MALSDYLATVSPNLPLLVRSREVKIRMSRRRMALSAAEMAGAKALGLTPESTLKI
nr:phage protease [Glaesserella parasuis]